MEMIFEIRDGKGNVINQIKDKKIIRENLVTMLWDYKRKKVYNLKINNMGYDQENNCELYNIDYKDREFYNSTYHFRNIPVSVFGSLDTEKMGFSIKDLLSDVKNPQLFYIANEKKGVIQIISMVSNEPMVMNEWNFANGICFKYVERNKNGKFNKVESTGKQFDEIVAYNGDVRCTYKIKFSNNNSREFRYQNEKFYIIETVLNDTITVGLFNSETHNQLDGFVFKPAVDDEKVFEKFYNNNKNGATKNIIEIFFEDFREYLAKGDSMFADRPTYQMVLDKVKKIAKPIEEMNGMNFSAKKKYSKAEYEQYLNCVGESLSDEEFIMAGKMRRGSYGTLMRKYDPIGFEEGYHEWLREHNQWSMSENRRKPKLTFWF